MKHFSLTLLLVISANVRAETLPARVLTPEVQQHARAEIALTNDNGAANPFNPNEIALDATVTMPSGKTFIVPGFWFQDFSRSLKDESAQDAARVELLKKAGEAEWRVRFSSAELGTHRVVLALKTPAGVRSSAAVDVNIVAGNHPGPVRVSPRNKRFLEHANGRAFFPIGQNLCMSPAREGTYYYERIFPKLTANGANYVRLWQEYMLQGDFKQEPSPGNGSNTGFPLETVMTGIGVYDLECAWKLDTVSDLCNKHGIYWQLCFEMAVWWNTKMPHRWKRSRYSAANGGPVTEPIEYLTKPECRELAARRHRYSVARWGWSPNLIAWEMWNEVDNIEGFTSEANAAWHKDLCTRLKAVDPFKKLIATSWRDPAMFALPEIDFVQTHQYWSPALDTAQYTLLEYRHRMEPFEKPCLFGEQGCEEIANADSDGKVFHDAIWSSSLSGSAGTGMHWYWNNYIDKHGLYKRYKPLSAFLRGVDWPGFEWRPVGISRPSVPVTLNVYGLTAPDRALIWVHDPLAYRVTKEKAERGPEQNGASVNITGLEPGHYKIEFYSTTTGELLGKDSQPLNPQKHVGYGIQLDLPKFWGDIAVKILRQGKQWDK